MDKTVKAELESIEYSLEIPVTIAPFELLKFRSTVRIKGSNLEEVENVGRACLFHSLVPLATLKVGEKINAFINTVKTAVASTKKARMEEEAKVREMRNEEIEEVVIDNTETEIGETEITYSRSRKRI